MTFISATASGRLPVVIGLGGTGILCFLLYTLHRIHLTTHLHRTIMLLAIALVAASLLTAGLLAGCLFRGLTHRLRQTEARLQAHLGASNLFTYEMDLRSGHITSDARWKAFWGSGPDDAPQLLEALRHNLYPESRQVFDRLLLPDAETRASASPAEVNVDMELQVRVANGDTRWCRLQGRIEERDAQGAPLRVTGTGLDITAHKRAEETEFWYRQLLEDAVARRTSELELSRNQAEAASQAKSAFLSTVSHEIRTPMNAIVGFTHIFDRSNLTPVQKEQLEKIRLSSATLLSVINDVLDISKIEAGKLELENAPFHLHTVLDTVCSIVDYTAFSKGLKLKVHVDPDMPVLFSGDAKRVSQILLNLLNNAVKFTDKGGVTLEVLAAGRLVDASRETVLVECRVTDTGIGLNSEQQARLFMPFMQADASVTRRFGGTGLGLAISRQLVEHMGGHIGVRSEAGQGSCFHFTIPLDVADAEAAAVLCAMDKTTSPEALAEIRALAGAAVLVAEDNLINQEIAAALLGEYGITPDMAANGEEALTMVLSKRYDCILMDVQMPLMDGLETTSRLRQLGERATNDVAPDPDMAWLASIPVIAMTANAMSGDRQRCLEAGMDDHLAKPIEPEALLRCLRHWIRAVRKV